MRTLARRLPPYIGLLVALVFSCGVRSALATGGPFGNGAARGIYLLGGANVGAGTQLDGGGTGLLLGGEFSLFDTAGLGPDLYAFVPQGVFIDALWDRRSSSWRFSAGPELVVCPFVGFDLGAVLERTADDLKFGARFRYFAAFPFVLPYVGVTMVGSVEHPVLEAGALLKIPVPLYER
jgi:hypothetical protein